MIAREVLLTVCLCTWLWHCQKIWLGWLHPSFYWMRPSDSNSGAHHRVNLWPIQTWWPNARAAEFERVRNSLGGACLSLNRMATSNKNSDADIQAKFSGSVILSLTLSSVIFDHQILAWKHWHHYFLFHVGGDYLQSCCTVLYNQNICFRFRSNHIFSSKLNQSKNEEIWKRAFPLVNLKASPQGEVNQVAVWVLATQTQNSPPTGGSVWGSKCLGCLLSWEWWGCPIPWLHPSWWNSNLPWNLCVVHVIHTLHMWFTHNKQNTTPNHAPSSSTL
jgi:hypothetical protein